MVPQERDRQDRRDPSARPDGMEIGDALQRIAPRVETRPWNRQGTDKSWVLRSMWSALLLRDEIRHASRVRG
jgi:hypothetical protein